MIVKTRAELDAAIAAGADYIEIRSPRGVWIEVGGSASVRAFGSASVRAFGSASVRAFDSASVRAFDSASVRAFGSASVRAFGSASVSASKAVAVHLHSASVKVKGGVVIDVSKPLTDGRAWCDHHGVKVTRAGIATVYKAVNDKWTTGYGFDYTPGAKPSAPDWRDDNDCGGGLHFSPTPHQALSYNPDATKFVAVGVRVADLRPIPGGSAKCKAPRVVRAAVEVDIDGNVVSS